MQISSLPPIRRFLVEDFKTQKSWISPLLLTLNNFMEATVNAFNKSLTLSENTTADIKTVVLYGVPTASAPTIISWGKTNVPTVVLVGNVALTGGAAFVLLSGVSVQWLMTSATSLAITNVVGIMPTASSPYTLTLVCFTG